MYDSRRDRFVVITLGMLTVAFPLALFFTPSDPYMQVVVAVTLLAFVLTAANLLSHETVYEWYSDK
jgi:Sec-independent protein secretion pathway component TatC